MRRTFAIFLFVSFASWAGATEPLKPASTILAPRPLGIVPSTQTYQYMATFSQNVRAEGAINAGGIIWKCGGLACRTSGPWPVPGVGSCNALALQEGRIVDYGYPLRKLSSDELVTCNRGVATAPATTPAMATPRAWSPVTIRTTAIQVTGTGALAARLPFTPVNLRTVTIQVTGAPVAASTFTPVRVTTPAITVTGTGSP